MHFLTTRKLEYTIFSINNPMCKSICLIVPNPLILNICTDHMILLLIVSDSMSIIIATTTDKPTNHANPVILILWALRAILVGLNWLDGSHDRANFTNGQCWAFPFREE